MEAKLEALEGTVTQILTEMKALSTSRKSPMKVTAGQHQQPHRLLLHSQHCTTTQLEGSRGHLSQAVLQIEEDDTLRDREEDTGRRAGAGRKTALACEMLECTAPSLSPLVSRRHSLIQQGPLSFVFRLPPLPALSAFAVVRGGDERVSA